MEKDRWRPNVKVRLARMTTFETGGLSTPACALPPPKAVFNCCQRPLRPSMVTSGQKVTSIEVYYDLDVAGTAATLKLYKTTLQVNHTIPSAAEVTCTCSHTEAQLYAADEQKAVLTITTPAFLADNEAYHVELSVTKAATTDLKFFGALVNFTRRL